uniref:protein ZW2-like n=1 Tax=Erigeron canadensis TaxID=72917 RepID=UPI001CB8A8DB|nr:protein ZW2-like [Erigeron canadensis]
MSSATSTNKSSRRRSVNTNITQFENFFQGWLVRQQGYLEQLRDTLKELVCDDDDDDDDDESASRGGGDVGGLITRVLAHYQEYYEEKSRIANHDVSLVFSAPWFSSLERSFFWIAGFKPALTFRIVSRCILDMTQEQSEAMERLQVETAIEERELENEMARIQESVAGPAIVSATRGEISIVDGKYDDLEVAIETLKAEMEVVLGNADMLRSRTAERVVEILMPVQNVKFLAAVTEMFTEMRMWGWHMEGGRQ